MNKINFRLKKNEIFNFFIKYKKQLIAFVLGLTIAGLAVFVVLNVMYKKEEVHIDNTSKISVTTKKLYIKEWGVEAPVNGNMLGDVSYKLSEDGSSLTFISSKLNNINLSSEKCTINGIKTNSWGLSRQAKKDKYKLNEYPFIIGNYQYLRSFPAVICDEVRQIDASFNYLIINLAEKKA